MAFSDFIREAQRQQRNYIRAERRRMAKAAKHWARYREAMRVLGSHPLTGEEITDRKRQLDRMAETIQETHGDSPGMRAIFAIQHPEA